MTTDLDDRIAAALRHHADHLVVDDRRFDPTRAPTIDVAGAHRPPSGRRLLTVAAAALAVGLVAGALVLAGDDGPDRQGPVADESTTAPPPIATVPADEAVAWIPTSVPEGFDPVVVGTEENVGRTVFATQVFASPDGGARVRITSQPGGGGAPGAGPTVRGVPAQALPSKEHPDTSSALTWSEAGSSYTADFTGMTEEDAVAFLDALVVRDSGPAFDAPAGDLALVGEVIPATLVDERTTDLAYEGGGQRIDVRHSVVTAGDPSGQWVRDSYMGAADDAGRLVAYDPRYDEVVVTWPEGRRAILTGSGDVGEEVLLSVALSLVPVDQAGLDALGAQVGADDPVEPSTPQDDERGDRVGPVISLVRDAGGRGVDLQLGVQADTTDRSDPTVCVLLDGTTACDPAPDLAGVASVLIDGHWYVAVASTDLSTRIARSRPAPNVNPVLLPHVGGGEVDGYVLLVAALADDVDEVWVGTDLESGRVQRPAG